MENRRLSIERPISIVSRQLFFVFLILLMEVMTLGACSNSNSWRQKLTVGVETPDGVKSAASVVSVTMTDTHGYEWITPPEARGARYDRTGEAVVMEVAPGRYIFVLLEDMPYATNVIFPDKPPVETAPKLSRLRVSRELTPEQYPLMVTFDDINDPASVKRVDPDDLTASFGPGYTLVSLELEITDEKVTHGRVEAVLGWLEKIGRERTTLIPNPPRLRKDASDPEIQYLTPGPFSTELFK